MSYNAQDRPPTTVIWPPCPHAKAEKPWSMAPGGVLSLKGVSTSVCSWQRHRYYRHLLSRLHVACPLGREARVHCCKWPNSLVYRGFPCGKESTCRCRRCRFYPWVWSLGREDPLEEGMATHSSIVAWRIPWTEEPDGLRSMESQRVRHDWATENRRYFQITRYLTFVIRKEKKDWIVFSIKLCRACFSFPLHNLNRAEVFKTIWQI